MIRIKTIYANNFMSFDDVRYDFEDKCYVIRGENLDDDGQGSNGSGKTTLIEIIPIAILGNSLSGRSLKDCVNWSNGNTSFTVGVLMQDGENEYSIERTIYNNTKSAELKVTVNGKVPDGLPTKKGVKNGVDVRLGKEYILQNILDITEKDLVNYFFISKKYSSFLEANTDDKLAVIGRFTNTKRVDDVIAYLQVSVKELNQSIATCDNQINSIKGYIEALEQSVDEKAKEQFELDKRLRIQQCEKQIAEFVELSANCEQDIGTKIKTLANIKIESIDEDYVSELNESLAEIKALKKEALDQDREYSKLGNEIQAFLDGLITCPKCSHEFQPYNDSDYTSSDLDAVMVLKGENNELLLDYENAESSIDHELSNIQETKRSNSIKEHEQKMLQQKITDLQNKRQGYIDNISEAEANIKILEGKQFDSNVSANVKIKKKELKDAELDKSNLCKELDKYNTWINNFENFKFYLGNRPIQLICSLVNQYLILNGSDLNLHIEGFKKLRSGELRQELTPVVYRNWMNPQPYSQFSGGEKVRLNISVDLAFQQLINGASKTGGLDFYLNDEILNPLDTEGVSNAAKAFNQLEKTMLLVTHSGTELVYENSIVIQKQNAISTVL